MKDAKGFGGRSAGESGRYSDAAVRVEPSMSSPRAPSPAYGGFEPVEVQSSDWENFTYEPTGAAPRIDVGVAQQAAPRAAAPGSLPRGIRGSGDADRQIDEALLGLSMPARPRNTNPAETQSFAPARDSDFELEPRQPITLDDFDELINSELAAMRGAPAQTIAQQDDDYALGYDEADADYEPYDDMPVRSRSRARSFMMMGGVAVVAIVAVAGATTVFLGHGGGALSGDGSMLIKADAEPYKIAPADPGGKTIPNQNKAVYQKVAGASSATTPPKQDALVTAMEEPIDIAEEEDAPVDSLPGVEVGEQIPLPGEEPVQQAEAAPKAPADDGTLQPRKVRTLSVRPDGTLVATEVPAEGAASLLTAAASMQAHAATLDPVVGIAPTMPFGNDEADLTTASTETPGPVEATEAPAAKPAPKPEPQRVAAVETPAPEGAFFVQIASQPSQAAAEDSLSNMAKRYSSVIGGRSLGIKAAEIPGKGTFYRVRVMASSRSEANSLCESLKSAGGSCFVTR